MTIVDGLGIEAHLNPRSITISRILQHVRRGRIKGVYSIQDGAAEIIEAEALQTSPLVGKPLRELDLPDGVRIGAIIRSTEMILPQGDLVIKQGRSGDHFCAWRECPRSGTIVQGQSGLFLSSLPPLCVQRSCMSGGHAKYAGDLIYIGLVPRGLVPVDDDTCLLCLCQLAKSLRPWPFMNSSVALFFLAGGLIFALHQEKLSIGRRQQFLIVIGVWFLLPIGAAMPYYLTGHVSSFASAYFEAVSGFTTTGSSLVSNLTDIPKSILLWRGLLQWMGGLTTLLMLSFIIGRIMGVELFGRDTHSIIQSNSGSSMDLENTVATILPLYFGLTMLCFLLLLLFDIPAV